MKSHRITPGALFLFAYLFFIPLGFSQDTKSDDEPLTRKEKIKRLKIAFITKELDLSVEQSEKFWPVYNEMEKKIDEKKKERKKLAKELKQNFETLSDADFKKKSNSVLDADVKVAELKKDYHEKIAAIIGYKKATKLLSLDAKFKRELLKKLNETESKRPANRPNGGQGQRKRPNR